MAKRKYLGSFEQLVLFALFRLGATYGMRIRQEIENRAKRHVAIGAAYATLDRLADAGYVRSWIESGSSERDGQPKRFYEITAAGEKALTEAVEMVASMAVGLPLPAYVRVR